MGVGCPFGQTMSQTTTRSVSSSFFAVGRGNAGGYDWAGDCAATVGARQRTNATMGEGRMAIIDRRSVIYQTAFLHSCIPAFPHSCIPAFLHSCIPAFLHFCIGTPVP